MLGIIAAALWVMVVTLLIRRAARQFQAYEVLRPETAPADDPVPSLAVIVPARNEAATIVRCLAGLRAQDYPAERLRVLVVDDGSTDGTAAIAAHAIGGDPRFRIIAAGSLPTGWAGKPHACWKGAAAAEGEWLCFLDADTVAAPFLLRTAIATAGRRGLDLLSLEPRLELETVWERLVIPAGLFALAFIGDVRRTNDPARRGAAANGQFMLIRRSAYERIGGHAAVRAAIIEDTMLAAKVKEAGLRFALLGGAPLIRTRMYRSLPALWEGLSKNVAETLGGVPITLLAAGLGPLLAWTAVALPLWLGAAALGPASGALQDAAFALASLASLALLGLHMAGARYLAIPVWYGGLFPVGYTLAALLAASGLRARRRGRVGWKGRIYRTRSVASGHGGPAD